MTYVFDTLQIVSHSLGVAGRFVRTVRPCTHRQIRFSILRTF